MRPEAVRVAREVIAHHSRSFALASRLLPPDARDRAVVVYSWCRRADDTVDLAKPGEAAAGLHRLRRELDEVYGSGPIDDPVLDAFRQIAQVRRIPRRYPEDLLDGLAMDVDGTRYLDQDTLLLYSHRVAGVVGLMMCHVMGLRDPAATINAAHLGIAMQLTNICRDVLEDWGRGRLYLPTSELSRHEVGWLADELGSPFPERARAGVAATVAEVLDLADRYYRSGDAGIPALSWRCGLAVRTARRVYAAIGDRIRAVGCDPGAGRVWTSRRGKLTQLSRAAVQAMAAPSWGGALAVPVTETHAEDVLPL